MNVFKGKCKPIKLLYAAMYTIMYFTVYIIKCTTFHEQYPGKYK